MQPRIATVFNEIDKDIAELRQHGDAQVQHLGHAIAGKLEAIRHHVEHDLPGLASTATGERKRGTEVDEADRTDRADADVEPTVT